MELDALTSGRLVGLIRTAQWSYQRAVEYSGRGLDLEAAQESSRGDTMIESAVKMALNHTA